MTFVFPSSFGVSLVLQYPNHPKIEWKLHSYYKPLKTPHKQNGSDGETQPLTQKANATTLKKIPKTKPVLDTPGPVRVVPAGLK